jgi:2-polyprenyl-6-methoxyphenol hydroxylase-like FAD-dependent oxidoreductase
MKIIIVGAGISGLSTYLFLLKHLPDPSSHTITIVEAYDTAKLPTSFAARLANSKVNVEGSDTFTASVIGSALGISANGLAVLRRIDGDGSTKTLDKIVSKGHIVTKWSLNCSRGWELGQMNFMPLTKKNGEVGNGKDPKAKDDALGTGIIIVRHMLWDCLRDSVVEAGGQIVTKRVVNIVVDEGGGVKNGHAVTVTFADGTVNSADLVIGADGLKSVVRKVMFRKEKEKGGKDYITPQYEYVSIPSLPLGMSIRRIWTAQSGLSSIFTTNELYVPISLRGSPLTFYQRPLRHRWLASCQYSHLHPSRARHHVRHLWCKWFLRLWLHGIIN